MTTEDIELIKQSNQNRSIRLELLNKNMQTIDSLEGVLISDNYTVDVNSNSRRSIRLELFVKDNTFIIGENAKVWFDKYIRVYYGIENLTTNKTKRYLNGTYIFNEYAYDFDATTNQLTLTCLDLMALLDNTINGQISGALTTKVTSYEIDEYGSYNLEKPNLLRDAIIAILKTQTDIKNYIVEDMTNAIKVLKEDGTYLYGVVPYDLEFSTGASIYEILKQMVDLLTGWQMYFDEYGTLRIEPYPTKFSDEIFLDEDVLQPLIISENRSSRLGSVRNFIEVWGRCLSSDYYSEDVSYEDNLYVVNFNSIILTDEDKDEGLTARLKNRTTLSFKIPKNNTDTQAVKILVDNVEIGTYFIVEKIDEKTEDYILNSDVLEKDKYYVFEFLNDKLFIQGQYQIHAIAINVNTEPDETTKQLNKRKYNCDNIIYVVNENCPFSIEKIGLKKQVLSGDEYDNIYSDELAKERAEWELYKSTRLQDTVSLEIVDIPFFDVNKKIKYKSFILKETEVLLTQSINGSVSKGTANVECIKFYPTYAK